MAGLATGYVCGGGEIGRATDLLGRGHVDPGRIAGPEYVMKEFEACGCLAKTIRGIFWGKGESGNVVDFQRLHLGSILLVCEDQHSRPWSVYFRKTVLPAHHFQPISHPPTPLERIGRAEVGSCLYRQCSRGWLMMRVTF